MFKFIKKIWDYGWARNGFNKLMIAMATVVVFALLFRFTEVGIFLYLMYAVLGYLGVFFVVSILFGWFINPISALVRRIKQKRSQK
jgi:hypothetical protein